MTFRISKPATVLLFCLATITRISSAETLAPLSVSGAAQACPLKDRRICDIDALLRMGSNGHLVSYLEDGAASGVAAEYEWTIGGPDIIHLGETRDFSYDELFFLVAHEFGHSVHRHGREVVESVAAPGDRSLPDLALLGRYASQARTAAATDRELNYRQEFDADTFAVQVMVDCGGHPTTAMRSVLKNDLNTATHPPRRARLVHAAEELLTGKKLMKCRVPL